MCFLMLRQQHTIIQAIIAVSPQTSREMLNWTAKLRVESVIDVYALVLKAEREIRSSSITTVELAVEKVFLVSAASACPIMVEDCMRPPQTIETQKQALEEVEQQIVALTAAIKGSSESENEEKMKPLAQLRSKKANLPTFVEVELNTRLDNRVIDLRVRSNSMVMWACCSSQTRFFVYVFLFFLRPQHRMQYLSYKAEYVLCLESFSCLRTSWRFTLPS
jgi:aspartyl/asparaginyl-tRNA synthetase